MPKALSKVQKRINAKRAHKDSKGVHENSRDHRALTRASLREDRLSKVASQRAKQKMPELVRLQFFQEAMENKGQQPLEMGEVRDLINQCIHRDDEELDEMKARRGSRPSSTKEDLLRLRVKQEEEEFRTGYRVPDLTDPENIANLIRWDGSISSLGTIKFVRVMKE